jgi:Protein of unknown function DUF111
MTHCCLRFAPTNAHNMFCQAFLDSGFALTLQRAVHRVQVEAGLSTISDISGEWGLQLKRVHKGSGRIAAAHVQVTSVHKHKPAPVPQTPSKLHSHEHQHSHEHSHNHSSSHEHNHEHNAARDDSSAAAVAAPAVPAAAVPHSHDHAHAAAAAEHSHAHSHGADGYDVLRGFHAIEAMLLASGLPQPVKEKSIAVFHALALAGIHDDFLC